MSKSSELKTRPVHPCLLSAFDGTTGAEYACWAHITTKREEELPNLVTAQGSTLRIYTIDSTSGKLLLTHSFTDLAGTVCYLACLSGKREPDSLLIGFGGHPRLVVVSVMSAPPDTMTTDPTMLIATVLIDLTQALMDHCMGSVTPLEQDLVASLEQKSATMATLSVILGGGVTVAALSLRHVHGRGGKSGWTASEPYLLPLATLYRSLQADTAAQVNTLAAAAATTSAQSVVAHGFGDVLSICFLSGYLEPTLVMLHSNGHDGRTWSGRLGRANGAGGTQYGLNVTCISLTVVHHRSAILWSVQVPADALSLHSVGTRGCLVMCVNSLLEISNSGHIFCQTSVNGWVKSTCPPNLLDKLEPNPFPFPKLAIQLDGARISFLSDQAAVCCLRSGHLYLLQNIGGKWGLMALRQTLSLGQVSSLLSLPLTNLSKGILQKITGKQAKTEMLSVGMVFCGSRLGDSFLLEYTMEKCVMDSAVKMENEDFKKPKLEDAEDLDEREVILRREEDALYADTTTEEASSDEPNVIPPSSSDEEDTSSRKRERSSQVVHLSLIRSLKAVDKISSLGPLGPGCEGPLAKTTVDETVGLPQQEGSGPLGATVQIMPCGYGSSGGLALLTLPGRDDRSLLAEVDCMGATCLFSLPRLGLVLMGMEGNSEQRGGVSVFRMQLSNAEGVELSEVDLEKWCSKGKRGAFNDPLNVLHEMTLLSAAEFDNDSFVLLVKSSDGPSYGIVILSERKDKLHIRKSHTLSNEALGSIVSTTSMFSHKKGKDTVVTFGCTWSSGKVTVITVGVKGALKTEIIDCSEPMETKSEDTDEAAYYQNDQIHAIDIFLAPQDMFTSSSPSTSMEGDSSMQDVTSDELEFDDEDLELYGSSNLGLASNNTDITTKVKSENEAPDDTKKAVNEKKKQEQALDQLYVAVCRQSGALQVYALDGSLASPIWEASGCGQGAATLDDKARSTIKFPRMHKVHANEVRFFFTGPSLGSETGLSPESSRTFNLIVDTTDGDVHFYEKDRHNASFRRKPLRNVTRKSKEEIKHTAKLRRKGILGAESSTDIQSFRYNRLLPFTGITGQDGLFAAVSRPMWFISERGSLAVLCHRSRHVAPAGGKPVPVMGFCVGVQGQLGSRHSGFMTLHERIGRVGSQRLSYFGGLSNLLTPHGVLPGGGFCVEKVPLGVTVRAIKFINDSTVSSGAHPLYAVLISREVEADQSHLNDDGLTPEEKREKEQEREAEKVKRQVEADLGGFDVEQEWVEEIEREDCFEVDMSLGGAPPVQKRAYALWIVDASNNWNVVDSFEFQEYEHGMSMEVMHLTEVNEEPGTTVSSTVEDEAVTNTLFITVGTGILDNDGEDVASKGRVLLFRVNRQRSAISGLGSPVAELSLVYEKDILHGAVTTLRCLACEGRNRLVVGAGADVNVEQWGANKLTQVGFFRAQMQINDIFLFKTFFLLSDAYDSLYFLVWRESDKSLTLLAKDYEPIPVFAAGVMSRGGSMTFLCQDDRQNFQFFQYAPKDPAARGGNKLVCRADIHIGSQVVGLQNHFCRSGLLVNSATPVSTLAALKQQDSLFGKGEDGRLGVHFGTSDGGFGSVVPVSEPVYWRLAALQSVLANALESNCSLSHRAWRLYRRTPRRGGCRNNDRKKAVIDGNLVIKYADLPLQAQEDLASAIGTTVELVLDNLLDIRCASMVL